jgi:glutamate-1-semialdehyde 2,1-aminomutase
MDFDTAQRGGRPKVLHQGTFAANPVSMAAGLAVLRELERIGACTRANELGTLMRTRLNEMAVAERLPFSWYGEFSAFHMRFQPAESDCSVAHGPLDILRQPQPLTNRFRMAITVLGSDINSRGSGLLSAVHTEEEIDRYVDTAAAAAALLRRESLI